MQIRLGISTFSDAWFNGPSDLFTHIWLRLLILSAARGAGVVASINSGQLSRMKTIISMRDEFVFQRMQWKLAQWDNVEDPESQVECRVLGAEAPQTSLGKTFLLSSTVPYVTPYHFGALFQILSKLPMSVLICWARTKHQEIILNQSFQDLVLMCQLLAWSGHYLSINVTWDYKALWATGLYLYIVQKMEEAPAFYFTERKSGHAEGKWVAH